MTRVDPRRWIRYLRSARCVAKLADAIVIFFNALILTLDHHPDVRRQVFFSADS